MYYEHNLKIYFKKTYPQAMTVKYYSDLKPSSDCFQEYGKSLSIQYLLLNSRSLNIYNMWKSTDLLFILYICDIITVIRDVAIYIYIYI